MVSGRNGGVVLTFRGGGVGVIAGDTKESSWRGRRRDEPAVIWLGKSDHAGELRGVATPVLSSRCLEVASGVFTVRRLLNIVSLIPGSERLSQIISV